MRKDHRHILMSDWDFRFVSYDVPECGVGGFDYKASNLEGKSTNAADDGCGFIDGVGAEARLLQGILTGHRILKR